MPAAESALRSIFRIRMLAFVDNLALISAGLSVSRCVPSGGTLLNGFSSFLLRTMSSSHSPYRLRLRFHSRFVVTWQSLRVYSRNQARQTTYPLLDSDLVVLKVDLDGGIAVVTLFNLEHDLDEARVEQFLLVGGLLRARGLLSLRLVRSDGLGASTADEGGRRNGPRILV